MQTTSKSIKKTLMLFLSLVMILSNFAGIFSYAAASNTARFDAGVGVKVSSTEGKEIADGEVLGAAVPHVSVIDDNYTFVFWTADKDVTCNGVIIPAGEPIKKENIDKVKISSDTLFTAIGAPRSITVRTHAINGTITPTMTFKPGEEFSVEYKPFPKADLQSIKVDGKNVDIDKYKSSYTFKNLVESHDIEVTYVEHKFNIKTEVVNGTITAPFKMTADEEKWVKYSPNTDCQLDHIELDGKVLTEEESLKYKDGYEYFDVEQDHSIKVVYRPNPKFNVEKKSNKDVYKDEEPAEYTITITNIGGLAKEVNVLDTLPAEFELDKQSVTTDDKSAVTTVSTDGTIKVVADRLAADKKLTITYKGKVKKGIAKEDIANKLVVTAKNMDDKYEVEKKVASYVINPKIEKTVSSVKTAYGEKLSYKIKASAGEGRAIVTKVAIKDVLPVGTELIGEPKATKGTVNVEKNKDGTTTLTLLLDELDAKGVELDVDVKVTALEGSLTNQAMFSYSDVVNTVYEEMLTEKVSSEVIAPQPVLEQVADKKITTKGDVVKYTAKVFSKNEIKLMNVELKNLLNKGLELNKDSVKVDAKAEDEVKWTFDEATNTLNVTAKEVTQPVTITYEAKVLDYGKLENKGELVGENFKNSDRPVTVTTEVESKESVLELKTTAGKTKTKVGDKFNYVTTITAKQVKAFNVELEQTLPEGLTVDPATVKVSNDKLKFTVENNKIKYAIPELEADKPITITFAATATKPGNMELQTTAKASNAKDVKADAKVLVLTEAEYNKMMSNAVRTGDTSNIKYYVIALGVALVGLGVFFYTRKAKKK